MSRRAQSSGHSASQRQLRVAELVRRTLSEVLSRGDVHDPELNALSITVSEVQASPDLRHMTAYVLPLGGEGRDVALQALKRNSSELRRAVARAVTMKFAPTIRYVIDDTFDRMDEARRIFSQERVRRDLEGGADQDTPDEDGADKAAED